uniref:Uncharacterized protein n=1 Tax=Apteryx owenii TaxID=8824 RepID=A0A8B9QGF0_APTOW
MNISQFLVNIMYQTSLRQFLGIFDLSVERALKSQITARRVAYIIEHLTYEVFKYTVRGLYENHRFLFTLLLALKIDLQAKKISHKSLGVKYAEGFILEMEALWTESDCRTPLICFLSMGSDPTENIECLSFKRNTRKLFNFSFQNISCCAISMGQGQEVHARRLLNQCMQDGGWLLLQNCHLGLGFLNELMDTVTATESMSEGFRTWITTEADPEFPINLLQSSMKFTNEPPQGVKAGLKRTYSAITQDHLEVSNMPQWKPLLYAIAFLHTTVQERRKFGPLGWNIPYEFNQADFAASMQFVQNHLDDMDIKRGVNWSCVRYMLGEVQYGGRVTDDLDKALLNTFARVWFGEHMFSEKFCFYNGYVIPKGKTIEDYLQYIEQLPMVDTPEVFGLHPNADITYQTNMANKTLSTIVSIQPKDGSTGGGETREAMVQRLADEMLEKLPPDYIPHKVYATVDEAFFVVVVQECSFISNLIYALDNMYDAQIPKLWFRISWESATLGFWFTELLERNQQFSSWLLDGRPNQFWMTGLFNPQGFLTAMRQETTRMNLAKGWALDSVVLHNDVTKMMKEDVAGPPPADIGGVYIYGLFLDGAGWDRRNSKLVDLPVVHVYAISTTVLPDPKKQQASVYSCPVYKKPRRTDLTYIFSLYLKTVKNPDHWTLRGVALLCNSK